MSDLLPCPFCGGTRVLGDGEADDNWFECMGCHARGPRITVIDDTDIDAAAAAWNRRTADPALLALARFGAWICRYYWLDIDGGDGGFGFPNADRLDRMAHDIGLMSREDESWPAPGIADAIARLLAPDGAGEVADG